MGECELRAERLSFQCLFQQERSKDVEFEVGPPEGQAWRLTAHRRVLAACSPVLRAMVFGPLAHKRGSTIEIRDIEPRAFDCLLRYAYGHPPQFQTLSTALSTLHVAHKYLCPGLEWECAAFLNEQVQTRPDCALEVFQATSFYCQMKEVLEPTAPPAEDLEADETEGSRLMDSPRRRSLMATAGDGGRRSNSDWNVAMGEASTRLRHNCLQTIDQHANDVLALEQLEDLDLESLLAVISRDSFAVTSEVSLFNAVERWAECECKRRKLPHAAEHLQEAFGGSAVICSGKVARLLLLSPQEFAEGPVRSPLLTAEEQKTMLVRLVGNNPWTQDAAVLKPLDYIEWEQLARPRVPCSPNYLPIKTHQYPGSCEGSPCKSSKSKCWRWWWPCRRNKQKPTKEAKKKRQQQDKQPKSEKPICCSKTCDYFIILIACLFD
ncbi:BTB/POZ domain-containing protein 1-like [Neocloeon triangulifer]|uniref:BTB/POZ domain-containing protein 1-like n=1 Tax=Neocloeon triangulifer TaxID=2078957 RepID=UPI00286EB6BB|nr:BTB/POZ domain-containing protein 1-like [Neocloeon triangulifer]XP_059475876.1 BTB/POZ domain-containing protein 1-like [Neocloeon triangulifer]XP_059475877.1 BTB/POZ domain-containing protein 1-like [Neocloeon triangulifer]XP_059475878.1 BTB/POZ domain-containing protein 1-like [Neocloeon triangulifer]